MNVNFEPIIRGLKSDILDRDKVLSPFPMSKIKLQKKKSGVKKMIKRIPQPPKASVQQCINRLERSDNSTIPNSAHTI